MEPLIEMKHTLGDTVFRMYDDRGREGRVVGVQDFDSKTQSYLIDFADGEEPAKEWVDPKNLMTVEEFSNWSEARKPAPEPEADEDDSLSDRADLSDDEKD